MDDEQKRAFLKSMGYPAGSMGKIRIPTATEKKTKSAQDLYADKQELLALNRILTSDEMLVKVITHQS